MGIVDEKSDEVGFPQKELSVSPEPGLRVNIQSPESQSIASLELESREEKPAEDPVVTDLDMSKTPTLEKSNTKSVYSEWLVLLTEIKKLYETVRNTFDNI